MALGPQARQLLSASKALVQDAVARGDEYDLFGDTRRTLSQVPLAGVPQQIAAQLGASEGAALAVERALALGLPTTGTLLAGLLLHDIANED